MPSPLPLPTPPLLLPSPLLPLPSPSPSPPPSLPFSPLPFSSPHWPLPPLDPPAATHPALPRYILHIFLGWSRSFRAHVWDWRVDQWQLGWSDLPALLHYQHRLQRSTDTALFEITEVGAAEFNRLTPPVEGVFYVSLPCQVTQGDDAVPLATNSPTHVLLAAINARWATASQPNHSDGLLSTSSQLYPQYQPHALIAELNPPSPLDK